MTIGPAVRYPAGPITKHGAYYLLNDAVPLMALRAYDDSIVCNLMGGPAIPDRTMPERVELKDMRGLIPPWKMITQKGASQDGDTYVDTLYDPMEPELTLEAVGRDPAYLRQVVRHLIASIDPKQESTLSFFTHHQGYWWAPVRWFKTPDDSIAPIHNNRQTMKLRFRTDDGFWRSYPHVDQFRFVYENDVETFDFLTAPGDTITGWTLAYGADGSGVLYTDGAQAVSTLANGKTVVARRTGFTATTDNVVVEIELGSNSEWGWPIGTYIDVWGRMNNTGTAGNDGVRFRLGRSTTSPLSIRVSSFSAGVETLMREVRHHIPARPGEKFGFVFGIEGEPRTFNMLRNKATFVTVKETGTTSLINSSHRKAGFGEAALGTVRPLGIRNWKVGDNNAVAQEGFVERVNVGDQPMWDRFTCFGPGTFYLGNGPSSTDLVKFGPLLTNQVMQVATDPRKRSVVDMTAIPPTPQEMAMFKKARDDFFSFLFIAKVTTSPAATESIFGIVPPQGNPYSLLSGRFNRPIPPRSPGAAVTPYHVRVKIDDGNSDSQVIVAGTPLLRLPY